MLTSWKQNNIPQKIYHLWTVSSLLSFDKLNRGSLFLFPSIPTTPVTDRYCRTMFGKLHPSESFYLSVCFTVSLFVSIRVPLSVFAIRRLLAWRRVRLSVRLDWTGPGFDWLWWCECVRILSALCTFHQTLPPQSAVIRTNPDAGRWYRWPYFADELISNLALEFVLELLSAWWPFEHNMFLLTRSIHSLHSCWQLHSIISFILLHKYPFEFIAIRLVVRTNIRIFLCTLLEWSILFQYKHPFAHL